MSIIKFKKIFFLVFHFEALQQFQIFFPKCSSGMVLLLVFDIADHNRSLGTGIRKRAESALPFEFQGHPAFFIDKAGGIGFDISDKIR